MKARQETGSPQQIGLFDDSTQHVTTAHQQPARESDDETRTPRRDDRSVAAVEPPTLEETLAVYFGGRW